MERATMGDEMRWGVRDWGRGQIRLSVTGRGGAQNQKHTLQNFVLALFLSLLLSSLVVFLPFSFIFSLLSFFLSPVGCGPLFPDPKSRILFYCFSYSFYIFNYIWRSRLGNIPPIIICINKFQTTTLKSIFGKEAIHYLESLCLCTYVYKWYTFQSVNLWPFVDVAFLIMEHSIQDKYIWFISMRILSTLLPESSFDVPTTRKRWEESASSVGSECNLIDFEVYKKGFKVSPKFSCFRVM